MNLEDRIRQIEALTEALRAAVATGDEPAWAPLLERRRVALAALDDALRAAEPAQRDGLASRLRGLVVADCELRLAAETALAQTGDAVRAGYGMAGRGPAASENQSHPAGLDRRA